MMLVRWPVSRWASERGVTLSCAVSCGLYLRAAVPNLFGTRDGCHGRKTIFPWTGVREMASEWLSELHLLCTLISCYSWSDRRYQSVAQRLGTPVLGVKCGCWKPRPTMSWVIIGKETAFPEPQVHLEATPASQDFCLNEKCLTQSCLFFEPFKNCQDPNQLLKDKNSGVESALFNLTRERLSHKPRFGYSISF